MKPDMQFDQTRTASHMPSQAARRILLAAAVSDEHVIQSYDIPGAFMRAPNDPNIRVTMTQPPRADGTFKEPGKICVMRRAMQGDPAANQQWDTWRDFWLKSWGWNKVMAEPSMYWIDTESGIARMEANNDDFLATAKNLKTLEKLAQPMKDAWQITVTTLSQDEAIEKFNGKTESGPPHSFQHVGLKITKLTRNGLHLSNPKIITNLLKENDMDGANSTSVPYVKSADLSKRKNNENTVDTKKNQSTVGTLRFIADATHPGIAYIVGILGRHLHDPCQRHMDAIKPILRYLSSRKNDGLTYNHKGPLEMQCYTDSDYAADPDTRRSVSGILVKASGMVLVWSSSRQATVTHSSTESEYIAADTGAKILVWLASLANELRIPMIQKSMLKIDDKVQSKYHDGEIVEDTRNDLKL